MNAAVDVRLRYARGPKWQSGTLTDRHPHSGTCGGVALLIEGAAYPPREVAEVRIYHDCPLELLDAAVEAGYWVLGQPAKKGGAK